MVHKLLNGKECQILIYQGPTLLELGTPFFFQYLHYSNLKALVMLVEQLSVAWKCHYMQVKIVNIKLDFQFVISKILLKFERINVQLLGIARKLLSVTCPVHMSPIE